MHISRKRLYLFILVLAQILLIRGETEETAIQTIPEETPSEEVESPEHKAEDVQKESITTDIKKGDVKEAGSDPMLNFTAVNTSSSNSSKVNCLTNSTYQYVEVVNATRLTKLLVSESGSANRPKNEKEDRQIPATCILVLFYAKWCIFSSQATPHFNALSHIFPHIKTVAIDAAEYKSFIVQYGIVGVPTLLLLHNGKPVAKFNDTVYSIESFVEFLYHYTNLLPYGAIDLSLEHFSNPLLINPSEEKDFCLYLSWAFIVACALYFTSKCRWWKQFVELVQNTWRESNAQHEHNE